MEKLNLKEFDNFINIGRDCRTLGYFHGFDKLYGNENKDFFNKKIDIFFDNIVFNNETYIKLFENFNFLKDNINNLKIEIYDSLYYTKRNLQRLREKKKGSAVFTIFIGRYNFIKFNIHFDDNYLFNLTKTNREFQEFIFSLEDRVFPEISKIVKKKIETFYNFIENNKNERNLFVRSEQVMSEEKLNDVLKFNKIMKENFKNSELIVISNDNYNINQDINYINNIKFEWKEDFNEKQFERYFEL